MRRLHVVLLFLSAAAFGNGLAQLPAVTTRAFDNRRSGANVQETKLNVADVAGLRHVTTIPVFGDARGIEAQPLILPGVLVSGVKHNVMVLPSMANVVRGVEATDGAELWTTRLAALQPSCPAIASTPQMDMHNINQHWGVLSTGVIDPDRQRVYLVAWCSPDATMAKAMHYIYALNLSDGSLAAPPVSLAGVVDNGQSFNSTPRKQRSSLVMTKVNGIATVFFACGTVSESTNGSAGWIVAFDVATNRIVAQLATSRGSGAGIWMAGQGLAADGEGYLYGITGNGSYNGVSDFGESVIKVRYQPPQGARSASLKVVDSWSPFSDSSRLGQNAMLTEPTINNPNKIAGVSAPSDPVGGSMDMPVKTRTVKTMDAAGNVIPLVYPVRTKQDARWGDEDFGSAGGTLIEPYQVYFAAGKDGIGYAVNSVSLGHTQPADFADMKANCAKLKSPPVWVAASPGPVDPCPQDTTTLDFFPWGRTRHVHSTPVQYWSPTRGLTLFVWGENSQLHAWAMSPSGQLSYLAQGNEVASAQAPVGPNQFGGMPGGFCSLSSNGNKAGTALLWCTISYQDANSIAQTNGRLLCYDPENLITGADGSQMLRVLWDSEQAGIPFIYNKFDPPIVWNGQVYVPNYSGGVEVFGLPR